MAPIKKQMKAISTVNPVLVMAAVPQEIALMEKALEKSFRQENGSFKIIEGTFAGLPLVVCAGGIGKINAAIATTALIERYQPSLVVNTGCAGAYLGSGLGVGDLVLASEEILGDEGVVTSSGWLGFREMGLPLLEVTGNRYFNQIPLSDVCCQRALQLAASQSTPMTCGKFITVSTCSGTSQRGEELAQRFDAIAENMEGAAVALTCLRYGLKCLEIRGISNLVEERNMSAWDIGRAATVAQNFVLSYLEAAGTLRKVS